MARIYPDNLPSKYVRDHHAEGLARRNGEFGAILREYVPQVFPGTPIEAWLGFASNGGTNERTPGSSFEAWGSFGVESTNYPRLSRDPRVVALLGRPAASDPGWMESRGGLRDQIATGLVNLRDDFDSISTRLPGPVRPASLADPWGVAMTFLAWSAGSGGATSSVARYNERLAGVRGNERFQAWGRMLAQDLASGVVRVGVSSSYSNPAHAWIRTQQKLRAGVDAGGFAAWLLGGAGDDLLWIEDIIARAASGMDPRGAGAPPPPGASGWTMLQVAGLAALGLGALYVVVKRR